VVIIGIHQTSSSVAAIKIKTIDILLSCAI